MKKNIKNDINKLILICFDIKFLIMIIILIIAFIIYKNHGNESDDCGCNN